MPLAKLQEEQVIKCEGKITESLKVFKINEK